METKVRCELTIIGTLLVLLASSAARPPAALAANGDVVHETMFSTACAVGTFSQAVGIGIAFDGKFLWYSCAGTGGGNDLFKADVMTGAVVNSYNVAGGLGALAWDGKRKKIWAGWGAGAGSNGDVRLIDPATGTGQVMFNAADAAFINLDDGLAYDAQDDSLYISPDTSTTIYHYDAGSGAALGSFGWTGSGGGCYNSGVAIGGNLLFQGSDGCNHVWVITRGDHSAAFDFATGADGVRDEDLECDSVSFSPKTVMWSVEAYEPRRAIAFEIPPGSCATGGGVDSDGDGLLDEWETNGITIDGGAGPQFIDLPKMGADPNKPDVFLQIDWMQNDMHSHKLDAAAIKKVVDAFAASPYVSPTGSVGINLHVDQGPGSILTFATNATWGALSKARQLDHVDNLGANDAGGNYDWSAFQTIKDAAGGFTASGRTPIFHYIISAHNYDTTTSSGISRGIGASDLIVSLGSFTNDVGTVSEQAGTLMHEFGHNLALRHGGGDDVNYKPNYLSIMNYSFQLGGLVKGGMEGTFDYSRAALGSLNKGALDERTGLGAAAAGFGTRTYCAGTGFVAVADASGAIDWDCDGTATGASVAVDVNKAGSNMGTLAGYDDWSNVKLKGGAIGLAGAKPDLPMTTETDLLTVEVARQIFPLVEDTGFVPPDRKSAKCEDRAAGAAAKLGTAILACHVKAAGKKKFNEEGCEQAAAARYDAATRGGAGCPACLASGAPTLRDSLLTYVEIANGTLYCAGTTAFGGDDSGFVPRDRTAARCAATAARNLARLLDGLVRCHLEAADTAAGFRKGKKARTIAEEGCEKAARSRYDAASARLGACPACQKAGAAGLRDDLETLLDSGNANVYCAGTKPFPH